MPTPLAAWDQSGRGQCKGHFGASKEDEGMPWSCLPATPTANVVNRYGPRNKPWLSGGEAEEKGGHRKEEREAKIYRAGRDLLSSP